MPVSSSSNVPSHGPGMSTSRISKSSPMLTPSLRFLYVGFASRPPRDVSASWCDSSSVRTRLLLRLFPSLFAMRLPGPLRSRSPTQTGSGGGGYILQFGLSLGLSPDLCSDFAMYLRRISTTRCILPKISARSLRIRGSLSTKLLFPNPLETGICAKPGSLTRLTPSSLVPSAPEVGPPGRPVGIDGVLSSGFPPLPEKPAASTPVCDGSAARGPWLGL